MSPKNFTQGQLTKIIEWSVANVTAVGGPDRAEHDILGIMLNIFWPIQAAFVGREPLCDIGTPSSTLKTF